MIGKIRYEKEQGWVIDTQSEDGVFVMQNPKDITKEMLDNFVEFNVVDGKGQTINVGSDFFREEKHLVFDSNAYFKTEQLETFIGEMDYNSVMSGERRKLIILHQNGEDKASLIDQLETMIVGLKDDFEGFAC